jgi:hypothetical protein
MPTEELIVVEFRWVEALRWGNEWEVCPRLRIPPQTPFLDPVHW